MSESIQNFEFIVKKSNTERSLGIYSDNKQQNISNLKPQDVISSVSKQLKAIQVADSLRFDKVVYKDLQKYKKSQFLSVNNLRLYDEKPKTTTKFDTQCVSDTQLINIIEDAEIIDVHRGMTQEFETTFVHHTEKYDDEKFDENVGIEGSEQKDAHIPSVNSDKVIQNKEAISDKENMNQIHVNVKKSITVNRIETNMEAENSISLISPIMCSNNTVETDNGINSQLNKNDDNTQIEENSQVFHDCIEIEDDIEIDKSIERPVSPIFMPKNVKTKSKTPSPLIFNLERFEQFEKIAIPILGSSDFKIAKQVINSQIVDKELCVKTDEEIQLHERQNLSPVLQNNKETQEFKTHIIKDPNLEADLEFIGIDKATSEDLIHKVMNEDSKINLNVKAESEILKDEILFSSDEEDNYLVHKNYQDLPFTCALETSFYDQSDVLDKTMFVGFQTASNKSIQIFTESFAQAKSILGDEITITDLVNNCDSSIKNKTEVGDETQANMDFVEETEFNLVGKEVAAEKPDTIQDETTNFEGFMTASNKLIRLSQKSLCRCKKVFQDIDLSDNFDTQIEVENLEDQAQDNMPVVIDLLKSEVNKNLDDDEVQNIDDEIIQEFENIEMSLKEDKEPGKLAADIEYNKDTNNKDTQISESAKIKDVIKDIDFDEDLIEVNIGETNMEANSRGIIVENPKSIDINLGGFKTASNKNISISKEALAKTKNVFQDLGSTEFPKKLSKRIDKEYPNLIDIEQPSTSKAEFVGFKTANNKNIKISEQALLKVGNFFKDIDKTELPKKSKKDLIENTDDENVFDLPSTSKTSFVDFKTANDNDINISNDALANTKNILDGIDSTDFKQPMKNNIESAKMYPDNFETVKNLNKPSTGHPNFVGFKTASNKNVQISKAALDKTKNIFKDIDSADFKYPEKGKKIDDGKVIDETVTIYKRSATTFVKPNYKGFKTANHKEIIISDKALAKTAEIFKDVDAVDFKYPEKRKKCGSEIIADDELSAHEIEMTDSNKPSTSTASFARFKTANNIRIDVSKEALAKTRNVFKDIDGIDFKLPEKDLKLKEPEERPNKTDNQKNIDETEDFDQPSASKESFIGFKIASNSNITISKESLAQTTDIFKDIDETDFIFPEKPSRALKRDDFVQKENIKGEEKSTHDPEITDFNQPSTSIGFMGFKTASNRNIAISKESLAKTKNIFKDIDAKDFKFPEKGTKDKVTIEGEDKMTLETEMIDLNQPSTSKTGFMGFKTANSRNVVVTKVSLAKTKNNFKDIDETDFKFLEKSSKMLENVDFINKGDEEDGFQSEMIDLNQPSTSNASFLGFKTASNKKVAISKESLAKTKNIFKDIDANEFPYPKENILERGKGVSSPYPGPKQFVQPGNTETGFKTANNKVINVSESALTRSKNLFENIDTIEFQVSKKGKEDYPDIETDDTGSNIENDTGLRNKDLKISETTVRKFQGFQTASNKTVTVSAEALVKSREIFQDIGASQDLNKLRKKYDLDVDNNPLHIKNSINNDIEDRHKEALFHNCRSSPVFKGFQTANKKPVAVSEEALAKSRKLFEDIETIQDDPEPEFHGFKTGHDEEVEVSQKTLAETKKLFEDVIKRSSFQGFQTANDKKVTISNEALAKSRKVFQNLEKDKTLKLMNERKISNINYGFKTSSNRDVIVSEEAVARTKRRFSEIDESLSNIKSNKKDKVTEDNIANMIDTQVLNNFEESLHTEDFHDTPVKSKRSGSPILSCPRAKRRKKFETPYSQKLPIVIKKKEIIKTVNDTSKTTFTENYKNIKKYTLKDIVEPMKNNTTKVDPYILNFTFDSLLKFEFRENRNDLSNGNMTIQTLKDLFLNSVNSKLVPTGWLDNHLKLILWKLISYEVKFKSLTVTTRNVMDQLKYRYDKELYNAQRPALRKILEKDDVASKTLVLCVAGIFVDGVNVVSATSTDNLELLLTDGWYCIKATIDKMLAQLVYQGKIVVGSKIVTNGAELVNCEQGISPWEDTSAVRLKVSGNSTRRAHWYARLGYHGGAILCQLSSVKLDGGKVSRLRVYVTRVYPALYVEKFDDGSTVTRSERLEHLHQMKSEVERQAIMEKIYEEVEKEFSDEESQDSESQTELTSKRTCLDSGSQIAKVMKRSKDPAEFRAGLTASQNRLLESHTAKHREHLLQTIQQKIRQRVEKAGVCMNRSVVTLLKIRVAGVKSGGEVTKGMMSIWKPPEAVLEIIKEGVWIDVMNVVPTAVRYSEIQISAGRQSVFRSSKYKEPENLIPYTNLLKRKCFTIKDLSHNPTMATDYNEIDTVGFIFLIDPAIKDFDSTKQPFQNVYLADADKNIICVNFWGGLKKFGYQNVLDTGQIVYGANLQKRAGNTRKSIPHYRVTEFSYFTKMPKNENARVIVAELSKKFASLNREKFCEDCVVLKNNYAVIKLNNENISPYRFNNSDFNMSKNKMFIDSPLVRPNKIDDNFNLTGLDFESTFKQTDTQNLSEEALQRKKKVNEKIARLKMYGEPPPLSTIHIINRSKNASSSYKSPLNSNTNQSKIESKNTKSVSDMSKSDSSINIASVKETPEKCENSEVISSPVLMNRTYVKSVNPVKINFDVKDSNDSNIDYFAEEFDGSPPLSLD